LWLCNPCCPMIQYLAVPRRMMTTHRRGVESRSFCVYKISPPDIPIVSPNWLWLQRLLHTPLRGPQSGNCEDFAKCCGPGRTCDGCCNDNICASEDCPFKRVKRLGRFVKYYKDVTAPYESHDTDGNIAALTGHEDLFEIIKLLRTFPDLT
jgi:hypothetical protein